jgi:threonine synthase
MTGSIVPQVCAGCGEVVPVEEPFPFRCPLAKVGDDVDHVLARREPGSGTRFPAGNELNPFVRYRELSYSWQFGRARGIGDEEYVALVEELDARVASIDGHGFRETPYFHSAEIGAWIKDETGNVAGSHKGRHLFGIALFLEVAARAGLVGADDRPLAVASCGNAALAAAVIARAIGRQLDVYLPTWANSRVVERLRSLGANLRVCERIAHDPPGDPCYLHFVEALEAGSIPFTCQGDRNGLTIDGGRTLAWELVAQHAAAGAPPLDSLFIQVGGGALASSTIQGLRWARELGALSRMPRIHAVQTGNHHPLRLAWRRVVDSIIAVERATGEAPPETDDEPALAAWVHERDREATIETVLRQAARNRSRYMKAARSEPTSIASGILDDETYDWLEIVRGMIETGGWPVVVSEETLRCARDRGREATGIAVDATGAAGLAGVLDSRSRGEAPAPGEVAVLFTGGVR